MSCIAHISDTHIVEDRFSLRNTKAKLRLSFLNVGRTLNPQDRKRRLRSSLKLIKELNVDHLIITGDLTEDGTEQQFESLAEILLDSGLVPHSVTLIAGNHDAYQDKDAFVQALQGPLRPFASTSTPCSTVILNDAAILPISTVISQPYTRSAGIISKADLNSITEVLCKLKNSNKTVIVAQHHSPFAHSIPLYQWIDGLQNYAEIQALITKNDRSYILHGHDHRYSDRSIPSEGKPRFFGTAAVFSSDVPCRLYEAQGGRLLPIMYDYRARMQSQLTRITKRSVSFADAASSC